MLKKILCALMVVFLVGIMSIILPTSVKASNTVDIEPESEFVKVYDTKSNYYTQVEDTTQIEYPDASIINGYYRVCENNGTTLYVDTRSNKFNIAIMLPNGYIFYSDPNYYGYNISAYLTTGGLSEISSTLLENGQYSSSVKKGQKPKLEYDFDNIENGFKTTFNYDALGIKLSVYVTINDGILRVEVPDSEIEENGYTEVKRDWIKDENNNPITDENGDFVFTETTNVYNFALASFSFFQYFGCVGYDKNFDKRINGYDFIPDGSGALSRFQYDRQYSTRLTKRVYGDDVGIKNYSTFSSHLSDDIRIALPIYGVSHGYNQNAFLCAIKSGDGEAELVLEPFGYQGRNLQTTYFRFYTREKYSVSLATSQQGATTTLPQDRYGSDYILEYSFLEGDDANYSGMAKYYRKHYLNLVDPVEEEYVPLGLNVLAQDYKKGLFGKKFMAMTTYKELFQIVNILEREGIDNFSIAYKGWNKGGYYNNKNNKPKISYNLGSGRAFRILTKYIDLKGYNFESCIDLLTSYNSMQKGVVKKTNLNIFSKYSDSSLFDEAYLLSPVGISSSITKYDNQYSKYGIDSINLGYYSLNNFQYRYKSVNYSRSSSIDQAVEELKTLSSEYSLSVTGANGYVFDYLTRYYDVESNATGYTYITDSIPFISLILSGYVELFSKEINFESDYNQLALRLVEYNIYPYFTITYEDSSKLRYTNSEYLYTSKFSLWKDDIVEFYSFISGALNSVLGREMVSHTSISYGVSKVKYSNGVTIYINHNNNPVSVDGHNLKALSYEVVK